MNDSFPIGAYLRDDLQGLAEYKPGKSIQDLSAEMGVDPEEIIKLDANENPYGSSPKVYKALADYRRYCRYPDANQAALRRALADHIGVSAEHILAGNGSDELIDLIFKLVLDPGDIVVNCPPTFGVYGFAAACYRGQVVNMPRREDFSLDVAAIERGFESGALSRAKLLVVCSPNNPDGSQASSQEIERLLALPVIVVLDEAYIEFSGGSLVDRVDRQPNLIILRTFSKWLGLAGLRVGYGVFPLPIARQLWKIKPPFNVNVAAQVAALAALSDKPFMEICRKRILLERERFHGALQDIPYLRAYPSTTNYVLVRVVGRSAQEVRAGLEKRGILVRHFKETELSDHLRISMGLPDQMDALVTVLREMR